MFIFLITYLVVVKMKNAQLIKLKSECNCNMPLYYVWYAHICKVISLFFCLHNTLGHFLFVKCQSNNCLDWTLIVLNQDTQLVVTWSSYRQFGAVNYSWLPFISARTHTLWSIAIQIMHRLITPDYISPPRRHIKL